MWRNLILPLLLLTSLAAGSSGEQNDTSKPNILLVVFEDLSPRIGAYGDPVATTPVLDAFAKTALLFEQAFTTSGVCAPSRSALITGQYQQAIGTQHMRTRAPFPGLKGGGPIEYDAVPPSEVKAFPELLRRAGYYTSNNGKTDYQFGQPFTIWDDQNADHPWRDRPAGKPFFAMVNIMQTHESYIWPTDREIPNRLVELVRQRNLRELAGKKNITDPASVVVPPFLPDTEAVRGDIARHYDNLAFAEQQVAALLADLSEDGLSETTYVIVTSDHGDGLPRMKRSLYDGGLHVPLMVRFPDGAEAGERNNDLVSFVDLAPTILELAGYPRRHAFPGRVFLGEGQESAAAYIYAAADRHDNVPGRSRSVRDARFKYIRNYMPQAAFFRPLPFRDLMPTMQALWDGLKAGSLTKKQAVNFQADRPSEELYDLENDPFEVENLASDPARSDDLNRLRRALDSFLDKTPDLASQPEAAMIETMWPGMEQPQTKAPTGAFTAAGLRLSSATVGGSIGYRILQESEAEASPWMVYTGEIVAVKGQTIEAKAIRYGYAESPVVQFTAR